MAMKKNGRISYRYRAKPLKGFSENGAKTYNKAIKFVPAYGLHRTPLSGRRLLLALALMSKTAQKKILTKVMRLERAVEAKTRDEPLDGYAPNKYGQFEPIAVREKEFDAYRDLIGKYPDEDYFRYSFASSLWRSGLFNDAAELYRSVIDGGGPYSLVAKKMLACLWWERGFEARAQNLLNEHNAEARARGETVWHETIEQIYPS